MRLSLIFVFLLSVFTVFSQNIVNEINIESYNNLSSSYNYTYWNDSWKTNTGQNRGFTNHTSSYGLNIDYTNLAINSLVISDSSNAASVGFTALNSNIFANNFSGNIDYAILINGPLVFEKAPNPTSAGNKDSQMAEYGVWCNRRFISTNFTNSAPIDPYFTGVEFTNWHNRFKVTFHVKPTSAIVGAQLKLAIDIPSEYVEYFNLDSLHAFGLDANKGFVIKGDENAKSVAVVGNKITVLTAAQDLLANEPYEVSILFQAVKQNLATQYTTAFNAESEITIAANQTLPSELDISNSVSYSATEGLHIIDIPRYQMGQYNCDFIDEMQAIDFSLTNSESVTKRVRLCFRQTPNVNVTGFNSVLCNSNGDPSGLPIQVSKNWHTTTSQLYSGTWIKEYTEIIVPANTTLNFQYKRTGAKWGETYAASSHQLSVVGAGIPRGGWLEAALGSFGESITHSPDYEYGNTNGADVRPFLVTNENYGGTSTECNWTGNVGGLNMWVYADENNKVQYQSEVKTQFKRYSPNLTETTIGGVSADKKLKLDYTFYLNRSDDYLRVYYKINIEALENTSFNRFDIFQLGGDIYNVHNTQDLKYGNDDGLIGQLTPTNSGSNDYTSSEIALTGSNPWIWAGDGLSYTGASTGIDIDANNGLIIRDYKATINGIENNTPYFRERSSSQGFSASHGTNPTSYCIVPPPGTTSFSQGDKIELLVEVAVLPKMYGDYYGPNTNFDSVLNVHGNSHLLLYRESLGNKINADSPTNSIDTLFPLTVTTTGNTGLVTIKGGIGYVPLVFTGLSSATNPTLWRAKNKCWELVDQSLHGKDFWQANYNVESNTFDLVYNVKQDVASNNTAIIQYYLGATPPEPSIFVLSKVGSNPSSSEANVVAVLGTDDVILEPKVNQHSIISEGLDSNYVWTGPNNFTHIGRVLSFTPVDSTDQGEYTVTYTTEFGCSDSKNYTITIEDHTSVFEIENEKFSFYPNPVDDNFTISELSYKTAVYNATGQKVKIFKKPNTLFNVESLPTGIYLVEFELKGNKQVTRTFQKK